MNSTLLKILVVEDDAGMAEVLGSGLREENYETTIAHNVNEALDKMDRGRFDLILLDLGLPGRNGLELLDIVRKEESAPPVVILTAHGEVNDRVKGLQSGADDYIVKPFAFTELTARIQAVLRRATAQETQLTCGGLHLDLVHRKAKMNSTQMEFTHREFDLLAYLVRHQGSAVSRDMLARDVWQVSSRATPMDNIIDVHISRLRNKFKEVTESEVIQTIRGVGFVLNPSP